MNSYRERDALNAFLPRLSAADRTALILLVQEYAEARIRRHVEAMRPVCALCKEPVRAAPLTKCQRAIFDFLAEYIASHGYAPSFEEIAGHFKYSSHSTVHEHLKNIERKGWIARSYNESRAITLTGAAV